MKENSSIYPDDDDDEDEVLLPLPEVVCFLLSSALFFKSTVS